MKRRQVEFVVAGSGPAGVSAALEAARRGIETVVIDEQAEPGGRMLSQVHEDPRRKGQWLNGPEIIRRLVAEARGAGVEFMNGTEVLGFWPRWEALISPMGAGVTETLAAKAVLVATGAAQVGLPFPGWTLPGVISTGAVQVMLHQHRILPGRKVLVVGTDPLAFAAGMELAMCGVEVAGVVLPLPGPAAGDLATPKTAMAGAVRLAGLALGPVAGRVAESIPGAVAIGAHLWPQRGFRYRGIPLMFRRCILEAVGDETVRGAVLADLTPDGRVIPGSEQTIEVDAICASGPLYPLAELAVATGECKTAYIEELGGQVPLYGPDYQTTAPGLFVAGSSCGVEGAGVALAAGTQAGIGVAAFLGRIAPSEAPALLEQAARDVAAARREAWLSFQPNVDQGRARVAACFRSMADPALNRA